MMIRTIIGNFSRVSYLAKSYLCIQIINSPPCSSTFASVPFIEILTSIVSSLKFPKQPVKKPNNNRNVLHFIMILFIFSSKSRLITIQFYFCKYSGDPRTCLDWNSNEIKNNIQLVKQRNWTRHRFFKMVQKIDCWF